MSNLDMCFGVLMVVSLLAPPALPEIRDSVTGRRPVPGIAVEALLPAPIVNELAAPWVLHKVVLWYVPAQLLAVAQNRVLRHTRGRPGAGHWDCGLFNLPE